MPVYDAPVGLQHCAVELEAAAKRQLPHPLALGQACRALNVRQLVPDAAKCNTAATAVVTVRSGTCQKTPTGGGKTRHNITLIAGFLVSTALFVAVPNACLCMPVFKHPKPPTMQTTNMLYRAPCAATYTAHRQ
jgi:hypothetical protein